MRIEEVLEKYSLPVSYYEYDGIKPEYIVYNEEAERPEEHGDNQALANVVWWQVHIFGSKKGKFREHKKNIKELLKKAGFYVTDTVTLYEKETKCIHVVIHCHKESED